MVADTIDVDLVTRQRCHLCDIAQALLLAAQRDLPLRVQLCDVDADPELHAAYDWRVPVVLVRGVPVCEGVFTPLQLRDALLAAAS